MYHDVHNACPLSRVLYPYRRNKPIARQIAPQVGQSQPPIATILPAAATLQLDPLSPQPSTAEEERVVMKVLAQF